MRLDDFIKLNKIVYGVEPKITKVHSYHQQGVTISVRIFPPKNFRNCFLLVDGHLELFSEHKELSTIGLSSDFTYDKDDKLESFSGSLTPVYVNPPNEIFANQICVYTRYIYGNNQQSNFYRNFRSEYFILPLNELTQNVIVNGVKRDVDEILYIDISYYNNNYNPPATNGVLPRVFIIEYDPAIQIW